MPYTSFSQILTPKVSRLDDKIFFCFDSIQANYIAKQLSVKDLQGEQITNYKKQVDILEAQNNASLLAFLNQEKELDKYKDIEILRVKEIEQYKIQLSAYQKSNRKARFGGFTYKALTFILAGAVIYFATK